MKIIFKVNLQERTYDGDPFKRLLDVLREDFGLTGTKEGCGEGECGACTILLDGQPVNSCLIPVCQAEGRGVETVESLGLPEKLSSLQKAFLEEGGAQCGLCTPGMLLSAAAHLRSGGRTDERSIRQAIGGNLCRCTGYQHIVKSIRKAAKKPRRTKSGVCISVKQMLKRDRKQILKECSQKSTRCASRSSAV
ncbi:MAG: (2Fe-2S)-binding protein [Elusimicrobia bacterium]|nr:(2Fe-2S)-binding protein [Elusimicrobiota bacterium]